MTDEAAVATRDRNPSLTGLRAWAWLVTAGCTLAMAGLCCELWGEAGRAVAEAPIPGSCQGRTDEQSGARIGEEGYP